MKDNLSIKQRKKDKPTETNIHTVTQIDITRDKETHKKQREGQTDTHNAKNRQGTEVKKSTFNPSTQVKVFALD